MNPESRLYPDLVTLQSRESLDINQTKALGGLVSHQKAKSLPRAKKSTSQAWLDSLECKPDFDHLYAKSLD